MVNRVYIPKAGDLIWVDFDPTKGKEQASHRPAIVITPISYNKKSGLALVCPITSKTKGYPFEVVVTGKKISGVALVDHVRPIDYEARNIKFAEISKPDTFSEVQHILMLLVK